MTLTPSTVTVLITLNDGNVAVMQFVTRGRGNVLPPGASWVNQSAGVWDRQPTADTLALEVIKTFDGHAEQPVNWRIISPALVPTDRTYRGAWTDIGGVIAHNMTKALNIHRDRLRGARAGKFADLDAAYLRADEANDTQEKKRIAGIKTRLRDLPADPAIDAAQTIDQLKAFWPLELA